MEIGKIRVKLNNYLTLTYLQNCKKINLTHLSLYFDMLTTPNTSPT